jgi:hypothetical protein
MKLQATPQEARSNDDSGHRTVGFFVAAATVATASAAEGFSDKIISH